MIGREKERERESEREEGQSEEWRKRMGERKRELFFSPVSNHGPNFIPISIVLFTAVSITADYNFFDYAWFPVESTSTALTRGCIVQLKVFIYLAPASRRDTRNFAQ